MAANFDVPAPGVRLADLAQGIYAAAGAATDPGLDPEEARLVERLAARIDSGFDHLDADAQRLLVDTATTVVEQLYAHLSLKRSRYAADPVQRLRLLRRRCGVEPASEIHRELAATFTALRDAHTRYIGPTALRGCVAALPFMAEEYGPPGDRRYLASNVATESLPSGTTFAAGVELIAWNGTPFHRAVEIISDGFCGSHPDARRARGLEALTLRSLQFGPLPDEHWVSVGYRSARGVTDEVRLDWRVFTPAPQRSAGPADPVPAALALGVDLEGQAAQRAKQRLFASTKRTAAARRRAATELETSLPNNLSARTIESDLGPIGHLRIWNFAVGDHQAFVDEVRRLTQRLPDRGLILDVRSNPGGLIWAAERLHQLFTPNEIVPTRFSVPATELIATVAADDVAGADLVPWQASIAAALGTGELYSQPIPLTDPAACNDVGQVYGGPVVCIADARTYSSGDLFAAGFVDNDIGPLITVGAATGGGGANVWTYEMAQSRLLATGLSAAALPAGCGFTFAFRRATRAAGSEGRPIEDVGVGGQLTYSMTRDDLLKGNVDLIRTAVDVIRAQRHSRLKVTSRSGSGELTIRSAGIDRFRVTFDGIDTSTVTVEGQPTRIAVPAGCQSIEVEGWGSGQVLQRRRLVPSG